MSSIQLPKHQYYRMASAACQRKKHHRKERHCVNFLLRFLLKYASRDEIALLGRGSGGIVEVRNAIAHYDEASPLYGFLRYRRRNVVIKYLPEDCSRLVQGSLANACICEALVRHLLIRVPSHILQHASLSTLMLSVSASLLTTRHFRLPMPRSSKTQSCPPPAPFTPRPARPLPRPAR